MNGKLFKNVVVSDSANPQFWKIAENAGVGSPIFGDRDFTIAAIQEPLTGAEQLLTSCDAKASTDSVTVSFDAGQDMTLFVALDSRVETVPDWLSGFTAANTSFTSSNDVTFNIYQKDMKSGESISLGSNGQSYQCVNFTVLAAPAETQPSKTEGDVNENGKLDLPDLVLLQKFLLKDASLTGTQRTAADMDGDGRVDAFDIVLLRKALINA
jgi:hypothetical protein